MIRRLVAASTQVAKRFIGPRIAARQPTRTDLPLSSWDLSVGESGHLLRHGLDLVELTQRHGSPLHLVDEAGLDRVVSEAMSPLRDGVGADIFYSYKTNPVPGVLQLLHQHGVGAEVISPFELWLALRLGVAPSRIIYNGPAKSFDSLCTAVSAGILLINANSEGDLELIGRASEAVGVPANIGLRVALPNVWQGQFGLNADTSASVAARTLSDDRFRLVGLHVHSGFTLRTESAFRAFVESALDHCAHLRDATGWVPSILDLGGSLACPTVGPIDRKNYRLNRALGTDVLPPDPASAISVGRASRIAFDMTSSAFAAMGSPSPTVVLEPGRALTSSAQMLLATVHDVKTDGSIRHAVLDAGINVAEPASTEYHQLFSATAPAARATTNYRLVGPICTPADVLYNNWRLPELEPGHVVAIMDSGAYFVPFSTSFSFPRPGIVLLDADGVRVLRRGESFDDIVALDEPLRPVPEAS